MQRQRPDSSAASPPTPAAPPPSFGRLSSFTPPRVAQTTAAATAAAVVVSLLLLARAAGAASPPGGARRSPTRSLGAFVGRPSAAPGIQGRSGIGVSLGTGASRIDAASDVGSAAARRNRFGDARAPEDEDAIPEVHYVFLVHGWLGNELEMSYLESSLAKSIGGGSRPSSPVSDMRGTGGGSGPAPTGDSGGDAPGVVVHSVTCNNGRTDDGIAMGGRRLAEEVTSFIAADVGARAEERPGRPPLRHATVSFVGNSLGGLYARHALSVLPAELTLPPPFTSGSEEGGDIRTAETIVRLHPNVFCTTATPHLGVASHTFLPIPRAAEHVIGRGMGQTGRDLFRLDSGDDDDGGDGNGTGGKSGDTPPDLIYAMCTEPAFLTPLSSFRRRILYANAFGTDFQVPTDTAAFLSPKSSYPHRIDGKYCTGGNCDGEDGFIATVTHTDRRDWKAFDTMARDASGGGNDVWTMSTKLDSLGWTKVFVDVRDRIPFPMLRKPPFPFSRRSSSSGANGNDGVGGSRETVREFVRARSRESSSYGDRNNNGNGSQGASALVESRELADLMNPSEHLHFPLGHTVMVANSKSDAYSRLNARGRPVMDKLASDLVVEVRSFFVSERRRRDDGE